jgi:hypothetical protein
LSRVRAAEYVFMKKEANGMMSRHTTIWTAISRPIFKEAGIGSDAKGLLFRPVVGKTGRLTTLPLSQADTYRMIRRRARDAGIKNENRKSYLPGDRHHGSSQERRRIGDAQQIAAHEPSRTTGPYDRHDDDVNLDEVEKIDL